VYLPPPCPLEVRPHDFSQADQLIRTGRKQATEFLDQLQIDGSGVYGHPHFHGGAASL
jgi:NTE family protein